MIFGIVSLIRNDLNGNVPIKYFNNVVFYK